ncbi:MAG: tetratricopeptide repeat protein [Acidobacteria bacterium]|nr:tetratricopeptide repeat protein [Acidobacteriota bacterium]
MHRPKLRTPFAVLSLASIICSTLIHPRPAPAQDLVSNEDISGGSSVFVFKEGAKKPQRHSNLRVRSHSDRGRASRVGAQATSAASKRRAAAIARRKKMARTGDRRAALSATLTVAAEGYLDSNQLDLAIKNFRDALAQDPKNTRATEGLSNALTAKGIESAGTNNNSATIPFFEEAVKLDPQNDVAFARLGSIYDSQGDTDKAIPSYEKAVALNPEYKDLYPTLGIAYVERGDVAKGQEALTNSEKAGLENADVDFLRGVIAFKNNRDDEALAAFDKVDKETHWAEAQYYRGQILARQGKTTEAVAQYRGALNTDPTFAPAAFDLGVEEYNSGNYNDAITAYKTAVQDDPDNPQAHANLASSFRQVEQYPAANGEYKIASNGIKDSGLYSEWGYCLGKTNEWDKATGRLNTAAEMTPTAVDDSNVGWAYYNAGKFQASAKNDTQAKADYDLAQTFAQRAVTLDPRLDAAYLNLGATQNALGLFQLSVQTLTTALGLHSNWVIALNELGYGYRGAGDYAHAISTYQQVVGLDNRNVFGLFGLSEAFFASGKKKDAKRVADQLRQVDPGTAAKLDLVIAGKVVDAATDKIRQKTPKIPRFPY